MTLNELEQTFVYIINSLYKFLLVDIVSLMPNVYAIELKILNIVTSE